MWPWRWVWRRQLAPRQWVLWRQLTKLCGDAAAASRTAGRWCTAGCRAAALRGIAQVLVWPCGSGTVLHRLGLTTVAHTGGEALSRKLALGSSGVCGNCGSCYGASSALLCAPSSGIGRRRTRVLTWGQEGSWRIGGYLCALIGAASHLPCRQRSPPPRRLVTYIPLDLELSPRHFSTLLGCRARRRLDAPCRLPRLVAPSPRMRTSARSAAGPSRRRPRSSAI